MMHKTHYLITTLLILMLAGCASYQSNKHKKESLIGTEWVLIELPENNALLRAVAQAPTFKIQESSGLAAGMSGINRYSSRYVLEADSLSFGLIISTKMAGPPADSKLEQAYLEALSQTDSWQLYDNRLKLLSNSKPILVFSKR